MIQITDQPIDTDAILQAAHCENSGATVLFLGTTRRFTGDLETVQLKYESYRTMAIKKMTELRDQAQSQWPIERCAIVHRIGSVPVGQCSVAIAVSSPHRGDAFAAAQWLIDTLKAQVPIWKQEHFSDGSQQWMHPVPDEPPTKPHSEI